MGGFELENEVRCYTRHYRLVAISRHPIGM